MPTTNEVRDESIEPMKDGFFIAMPIEPSSVEASKNAVTQPRIVQHWFQSNVGLSAMESVKEDPQAKAPGVAYYQSGAFIEPASGSNGMVAYQQSQMAYDNAQERRDRRR